MTLRDAAREFKEIPLGLVDAPELPSRSTMDEQQLDELTRSIAAIGLQQPIIVARLGERFEVIAGHRRYLACKRAGLVVAPAIVYGSRDAALEAIKYAENRFREDLNPADEAIWFAELLERDAGGDVDQLCAQLGEKRTYVEGRLLLFAGDELVFAALRDGKIRIGVAQELNKCSDVTMRRYFLDAAIRGGATVSIVAGWIQQWKLTGAPSSGDAPAPAPAAPLGPIAETNFFRCYVCGGTEHVHTMQPVNVHNHCRLAILDPLLGQARGE